MSIVRDFAVMRAEVTLDAEIIDALIKDGGVSADDVSKLRDYVDLCKERLGALREKISSGAAPAKQRSVPESIDGEGTIQRLQHVFYHMAIELKGDCSRLDMQNIGCTPAEFHQAADALQTKFGEVREKLADWIISQAPQPPVCG
ncbi:MAG: hypothetical protein EOM26_11465 [Alphaproteobacteria bacterium]|nr:hypothetical protein [Alphaproteobacteria bacterium]